MPNVAAPMDDNLRLESERLARSWDQHDPARLREYLVSSVEDPRTNLQSILTRHFLLSLLFPAQLEDLKRSELVFGSFNAWLAASIERQFDSDDWHSILHALEHGADNAEGLELPHFLLRTFATLPAEINGAQVINYIRFILEALRRPENSNNATAALRGTFERIWRERLTNADASRLTVAEIACGSANDFRFIASYGISRFLDFIGFDISAKNVANAREICPFARFEVANAFALPLADRAVQACYFHDLLEHLSPAGLVQAISELCRITNRSICAGLFSAWEGPDHIIRPMDDYHCNTLSLERLTELFSQHGFSIRSVHVGSYVYRNFSPLEYHNPHAYTLYCDRDGESA